MQRFWSICKTFLIAITASTVVAAGMNPGLLNPWTSDGIIFVIMITASFSLTSIIPFYLLERTRLSKLYRHLIFVTPWAFSAILYFGFPNMGSDAGAVNEIYTFAFVFYSISFWASYAYCFSHRYISAKKTPSGTTNHRLSERPE